MVQGSLAVKRFAQLLKAKQAKVSKTSQQTDEPEQQVIQEEENELVNSSSSDGQDVEDENFLLEDSEDDGEEEEETKFEKEAREFVKEKEAEERDANEELMLNLADRENFALPEREQAEEQRAKAMSSTSDLKAIYQRMQDILFVLSNFAEHRKDNKSRADYLEMLAQDVSTYFGYSVELAEKFLQLFSPSEALQFFEANETPRPVTLRVNSLKCRRKDLYQSLVNRGVNLDPIGDWTNVGLKVYQSQVPLGATPEYLAGHYMLQSASSFLPVMALGVQEKEHVLDMSCAPGGKASYVAALMKNTGVLVANDLSKERQRATNGNLHRLGVRNAIITNFDGRDIKKHFDRFDRILLDAPCTGLGIIARDPSVKVNRKVEDIATSSKLQKELILSAIDMLKVCLDPSDSTSSGVLVYSTCSVTTEENEDVVAYALKKRFVKLEPIDEIIPFGVEGFTRWRDRRYPDSMKLSKRFYPHVHNMDGFFVARLRKYADGARGDDKEGKQSTVSTEKLVQKKSEKPVQKFESKKRKEGSQQNGNNKKKSRKQK